MSQRYRGMVTRLTRMVPSQTLVVHHGDVLYMVHHDGVTWEVVQYQMSTCQRITTHFSVDPKYVSALLAKE